MSYASRVKKRRHKRIEAQARADRRSPETRQRWFLTLAKKPGKCGRCGDGFKRGGEFVFRAEPREVRCVRCADRDPDIRYRPSQRWEKSRRVPEGSMRAARG